jgi:hypothetical protein
MNHYYYYIHSPGYSAKHLRNFIARKWEEQN